MESFAVKGEWRVDADGDSKGADFIAVLRGWLLRSNSPSESFVGYRELLVPCSGFDGR